MKKRLLLVVMMIGLSLPSFSQAQVFGTGQTLRSGRASFGFEPAFLSNGGNNEFYMFFHGGYGIKSGLDMGVKLGVLGPQTYIGADFEWNLRPSNPAISLAVGAHNFIDIGLDGTLNMSFRVNGDVQMFTGLDVDIEFTEPEALTPLWLPIGLELGFRRNVDLVFEVEVGLNDDAWNVIGGGLNFYF